MATFFWRENTSKEKERQVDDQWPMPTGLYFRRSDATEDADLDPTMPVTGNNGLPVNVLWPVVNVPARRVISIGFNAAAAGDYAALDIMSNSVTDTAGWAIPVSGVVDTAGQVAILDKVVARCSEDSVLNRLRLHFYRYNPLPGDVEMDDNIAADFAKTTAGRDGYIGPVVLAAFADMGTAMAMSSTPNLREMLKTAPAATGLWLVVETLDAEANETAGMRIDFDLYFLN